MTARAAQTTPSSQGARSARRSCSSSSALFADDRGRPRRRRDLGPQRRRRRARHRHPEARRQRRELADLRRRRQQPRLRPVRHPPRRRSSSTKIPEDLQEATIAIEDENFYEHGGVDYAAIIRAAVENVEAGEVKQGASTITQQLVRNLYIDDPEDTIERKIKEAEDGAAVRGRVHEEPDPQRVPEHRLLRDQRRQDRGRRRGRRRRSSSTRTSPTSTSARRRCSPASRRRPPTTTRSSTRRAPSSAATRCSTRCADQGYITPAKDEQGQVGGPRARSAATTTRPRAQQYFFDFVQQELIDKYGLEDRRATAGSRSIRRSTRPLQAVAEQAIANAPGHRRRRGARLDRHRHRRDHRDGLLAVLRRRASSTSPPRASASPARRSSRSC